MRIGAFLPISQEDGTTAAPAYGAIRRFALAVERAGLDSVWVYDHLIHGFHGKALEIHEAWTILSAIAEATNRVELGTLVLCSEFRNPGLLAKMAATLDHLSDGRLILGLGCGWHDPEFEAFGYATDHKVGRFEDSLTIIEALIRTGRARHRGAFHTADDAVLLPPARPELPIIVAAKGPRMMDLTVRYANAWNSDGFGLPSARLEQMLLDIGSACDRAERDRKSLALTLGVHVRYPDLPGSTRDPTVAAEPPMTGQAEVISGLAAYAALGIDHLMVGIDPPTLAAVRRLGAAVSSIRGPASAVAPQGHE